MGIADAVAASILKIFIIAILLVVFGVGMFVGWLIWG